MASGLNKRIIIAAGGTAGHLHPAQALAQGLQERFPEMQITFVAGKLRDNPFFSTEQHPFEEVACGKLSLTGCGKNVWGVMQCLKLLKKKRPALVVGFGSYQSFPVVAAAMLLKIPVILYVADAVPGRVNHLFSPYAALTAVTFPQAVKALKGNTHVVEMPLRKGFLKGLIDPVAARRHFNLSPERTTVAVVGGSQGAVALNHLFLSALEFARKKPLQVIHCVGNKGNAQEISHYYENRGILAYVTPFEMEMEKVWAAADFAVCRAGAGTISEALAMEVPTILVPYPHAADDHQKQNARFVEKVVGGAVMAEEKALTADRLSQALSRFCDGRSRIQMVQAIRTYKAGQTQRTLAELIEDFLRGIES